MRKHGAQFHSVKVIINRQVLRKIVIHCYKLCIRHVRNVAPDDWKETSFPHVLCSNIQTTLIDKCFEHVSCHEYLPKIDDTFKKNDLI